METKIVIPIPEKSQPYNFEYQLTHYVFAPWVVEGKELVRLFKTDSGKFVLVRVGYSDKPSPRLTLSLISEGKLTEKEIESLKETIAWVYAVDDDVKYFYETICREDPVLKAASKEVYGAHLRTDPSVFESVLGVVEAQNVYFQRIYEMSRLLCERFGEKHIFNGKTYYTSSVPEKLANAKLVDIRACKVGYRDKYIKGIAEKVVNEHLDLDKLKYEDDLDKVRAVLVSLPGVGPYTAELTIAISFRKPVFHLDLFSREAMYVFYFKGKVVPDQKLKDFVEKRWGKYKHYAMLMLTTNTDVWAKDLGVDFRLKSAAKSPVVGVEE